MKGWLQHFPPEQIHVIQFEQLQEDTDGVLRSLKSFLGMDPDLPQHVMGNVNARHIAGGYPMKRQEYEKLVSLSRPDAERVAKMLGEKGLADEGAWMARWQAVWDRMLGTCDEEGICMVDSNRRR